MSFAFCHTAGPAPWPLGGHMNRSILALASSTALIISGPAYAQRGHGGGKPTTTPPTHGSSTTHGSSGATTHGSSGATQHGKSGSHGPTTKPTSSGNTHSTTTTSKSTTSGTT